MKVLHVSTECYPAAKAGGMGDVVGSLPKYLKKHGIQADVIIPKYATKWFHDKAYETVFSGSFYQRGSYIQYAIQKVRSSGLDFDLYCADIPGKFDRDSIYLGWDGHGFHDEIDRNIAFQRVALSWLNDESTNYDLVHCHDHMTGLIPFFMKYGYEFRSLQQMPSFFTIHNAAYYGQMSWNNRDVLPAFEDQYAGLLDWDNTIHSLATAVKCATVVNTVSPSYMEEIINVNSSLAYLFRGEKHKCIGILNGIDNDEWDTKTDQLIKYNRKSSWVDFKQKNKEIFAEEYGLDPNKPWFSFIGRFSEQKGVDTLAPAIQAVYEQNNNACFVILGSGDKRLEHQISSIETPGIVKTFIMYNEAIAHQIYASCDFILMPSRFEPCGLNQMFAMRYGTIPVVRSTGGLKDTVVESAEDGTGFTYQGSNSYELAEAMKRAQSTYEDHNNFKKLRTRCTRKNFSWDKSAEEYANQYKKLKHD
ncbi:glycogen synthase [Portibacter lacus]|uniref:Glycogen synthase n=1 Tax=Portibacter lacus TaxID=1099794 RepID=A0AA37SU22_9BACT|nr:glycogen/starch synthase [Portibacter lacus]GLR18771.1 glycogen synthase [Portibacter lacus]